MGPKGYHRAGTATAAQEDIVSVRVDVVYEGDLHCVAEHGPSGERLTTDAPADNRGRGECFSPTDLVGTAMGTCMLTIMGIAAADRGMDLRGARASIEKEMASRPRRHISRIAARITLPARLEPRQRALLEAVARRCPVAASLGPDCRVDLEFDYE
jgi:putative redox protein